jgi:hypothetical protein
MRLRKNCTPCVGYRMTSANLSGVKGNWNRGSLFKLTFDSRQSGPEEPSIHDCAGWGLHLGEHPDRAYPNQRDEVELLECVGN